MGGRIELTLCFDVECGFYQVGFWVDGLRLPGTLCFNVDCVFFQPGVWVVGLSLRCVLMSIVGFVRLGFGWSDRSYVVF